MARGERVRIGLVGDRDDDVIAHRAIPVALRMASRVLDLPLDVEWVATAEITTAERVAGFHGIWCVPASPYRNPAGALTAIRLARETLTPFLGTCGGFQHAVLEYARNVLGWTDAVHAEEAPPGTGRPVISPLGCALVETAGEVRFTSGSRLASAYGAPAATEQYHCRFGVDEEFAALIDRGPLRVTARSGTGEVRGIELAAHPFFVATLFQPERAALAGKPVPLANLFAAACADAAVARR